MTDQADYYDSINATGERDALDTLTDEQLEGMSLACLRGECQSCKLQGCTCPHHGAEIRASWVGHALHVRPSAACHLCKERSVT